MKHFAKLRRSTAVIALAGLAVAGVIGFLHNVRPGPDWTGGLGSVHRTDPGPTGPHAPGLVTVALGTPDPVYDGG